MQTFVVLSRYTRPIEEVNEHRDAHRDWLEAQYEARTFLVSGRRIPPVGGLAVVRAHDEKELHALLATDPYAERQLNEYELLCFEATDFPHRSPEFDSFISAP